MSGEIKEKNIDGGEKPAVQLDTDLKPKIALDTRLSLDKLVNFVGKNKPRFEEAKIKEKSDFFIQKKGQGAIDKDLESINDLKKQDEEDEEGHIKRLMVASFLTAQINNSGWMGEDAQAILVSDFDRLNRGNDILVEILDKKTNELIHFVIDVTFIDDKDRGRNIEKIKHNLRNGKMEELKYFTPIRKGFPVEAKRIPRVVAGFDDNNLTRIVSYWLMTSTKPEAVIALKRSAFQIAFLEEIIRQLGSYIEFASIKSKVKGEKLDQIINSHERLLSAIKDTEQDKLERSGYGSVEEYFRKLGKKVESINARETIDDIYNAIIKYLSDPKFMEGGYKTS